MSILARHWFLPATLLAGLVLGAWAGVDPSFIELDPVRDPRAVGLTLVAVALTAALMLRPDAGLLLFTGAVFLGVSSLLVRNYDFPSLLQLLALPLLVAGLVERDPKSLRRLPVGLFVLLATYGVAVLLSTEVALDRGLADERFSEAIRGLLIVTVVSLLTSSRDRLRAVVGVLVGAGALLALLAIVQTVTGDFDNTFGGLARIKHAHIYERVFEPRVAGPLGDPNYFAQMLLVVLPLALFQAWDAPRLRVRVAAWCATGLLLAGIALTYSRGGALALGLVLALALVAHGLRPRHIVSGSVVVVVGLLVAPTGFQERLATVRELLPSEDETVLRRDSSFQERLLLGRVALEMFGAHPLRGVGVGNYGVRFDDYADRVPSSARDYAVGDVERYPHNLFLELGAEGGVILLGAFCALVAQLFATLARSYRRFRQAGDDELAGIAMAVGLGLVGYLATSLFLHGAFQRHLWLAVGLAAAMPALAYLADSARSASDPAMPSTALRDQTA